MFGLFNKQKGEDAVPEWYSELKESQERWFNFLEKLEAKMEEFATAAIPELKEILSVHYAENIRTPDYVIYERKMG